MTETNVSSLTETAFRNSMTEIYIRNYIIESGLRSSMIDTGVRNSTTSSRVKYCLRYSLKEPLAVSVINETVVEDTHHFVHPQPAGGHQTQVTQEHQE